MKAKYKHLKENNTYLIIFKNEIWKQNTINLRTVFKTRYTLKVFKRTGFRILKLADSSYCLEQHTWYQHQITFFFLPEVALFK